MIWLRIGLILLLCGLLGPAALRAQPAPPAYYQAGELVLIGRAAEIDATLRQSQVAARELERIDLSYVINLPPNAPFPFPRDGNPQIRRYAVRESDPSALVAQLNRVAQANSLAVLAEPNYLIGREPLLLQGNPWSIGGSPWSIGGSGSGGGSEAYGDFLSQWALGPDGIDLFPTNGPYQHALPQTGRGVNVVIFDTSPFSLGAVLSTTVAITRVEPTLRLTVEHPALPNLPPPQFFTPSVAEHGLFVAGMAHVVAPEANYRLVRVLDDQGRGELFSLARELHRAIEAQRATDAPTVFNLSLGVYAPPDAVQRGLLERLVILESAISAADGFGLSVVAAAGNDGDPTATQYPAAYESVIAVAGSTIGGTRSCFSDAGEIAAPAGDGKAPDCTPDLASCSGPCASALIGPFAPEPAAESSFAYWVGTSFAAPLVTGAVALLRERQPNELPARYAEALASSARPPSGPDPALGAGILDLRQLLLPNRLALPLVRN